jgi:hypothetical protein
MGPVSLEELPESALLLVDSAPIIYVWGISNLSHSIQII